VTERKPDLVIPVKAVSRWWHDTQTNCVVIYVDGLLTAHSILTGERLWRFRPPMDVAKAGAIAAGVLVCYEAAYRSQRLWVGGIDVRTGTLLWERTNGVAWDAQRSTCGLLYATDATSLHEPVYEINPRTGARRHLEDWTGKVFVEGDHAYACGLDGRLRTTDPTVANPLILPVGRLRDLQRGVALFHPHVTPTTTVDLRSGRQCEWTHPVPTVERCLAGEFLISRQERDENWLSVVRGGLALSGEYTWTIKAEVGSSRLHGSRGRFYLNAVGVHAADSGALLLKEPWDSTHFAFVGDRALFRCDDRIEVYSL
jgi:hypothetical protein